MPNPYSLDLRERILKDYDGGVPVEDIVAHYEVSLSWLYSLLQLRRETGSIAPRPHRRGRKQKLAPFEKEVRQLVAEHPDATLVEFCEMLSKHVSVSTTALCDFLRHLKITRKKDSLCYRTATRRCHRKTRRVEETPRSHRHRKIRFH